MGLDMYLKARAHIGGYDFLAQAEREAFDKVINAVSANNLYDKDTPSVDVSITVGYWRKANAIHGWFVENVQDGKDECKEHYVSREQLERLLEDCLTVMADNSKAMSLLPPTQGFFFGTYELDEWYWGYIRETAEMIGKLLKTVPAEWDFLYRSSW